MRNKTPTISNPSPDCDLLKAIKQWQKAKGLNQDQMAGILGVARSTLTLMYNGKAPLSLLVVSRVRIKIPELKKIAESYQDAIAESITPAES